MYCVSFLSFLNPYLDTGVQSIHPKLILWQEYRTFTISEIKELFLGG